MAEADTLIEVEPEADYVPDVATLWAGEKVRAILVVLTRRLGPDFAREVHNEMFGRAQGYDDSEGDDLKDGRALDQMLADPFWDELFAMSEPKR